MKCLNCKELAVANQSMPFRVLDSKTEEDITNQFCIKCLAACNSCCKCNLGTIITHIDGRIETCERDFSIVYDKFYFTKLNSKHSMKTCAQCQKCSRCKINNAIEQDPFVVIYDKISEKNITFNLCSPCIEKYVQCNCNQGLDEPWCTYFLGEDGCSCSTCHLHSHVKN